MQDGHCPLHIASQKAHDRTVEMLLQAGATVDLQNKVEDCSCVVPSAVYSFWIKYHPTFRGI